MRKIQLLFRNSNVRGTRIRLLEFALTIFIAVLLLLLGKPRQVRAEVVCADDLVPLGMAVTATGTSPSCDGSCRSREIKPVCGLVMKICAGQPIPKGYTLDSTTSMPGCQCLGFNDDAYVIRYTGPDGPAGMLSSNTDAAHHPIPFGNPLCMANAAQMWSGGGGSSETSPWTQGAPTAPYPGIPQGMAPWAQGAPGMTNVPANMQGIPLTGGAGQYGSPWSNQTEEEPFRVGQ
jgi:hypothetical protein